MPKKLNLIGMKFGKLLVISKANRVAGDGSSYWKCQCECGNYTTRLVSNLRKSVSCGCYRKTLINPNRVEKQCSKCKQILPIEKFRNNKSRKDGKTQFCKECYKKVVDVHYRTQYKSKIAQRTNTRRKNDIQFRIADNLRRRVNSALRGKIKSSNTVKLLGCEISFLQEYLKSKFLNGMSWNNYGVVWEIDHIRPCASFDLVNEREQEKCFHYSNLQPMLVEENKSKNSWFGGIKYEYR